MTDDVAGPTHGRWSPPGSAAGCYTDDHDRDFRSDRDEGSGDSLVVDVEPGPGATALGATVHVTTADGTTHDRTVTAGANFLSQNPRAVHVGLDGAAVERVRVVWPDGREVVVEDAAAGERVAVGYDGTVEATG